MLQKGAKIAAILENSEHFVRGVRMEKSVPLERVELANQIQGFGIPGHWDALEKNNYVYSSFENKNDWGAISLFFTIIVFFIYSVHPHLRINGKRTEYSDFFQAITDKNDEISKTQRIL